MASGSLQANSARRMGMTAALKARQIVDHARHVLAIELLVASQALDLRHPVQPGRGVAAAHHLVRAHIPPSRPIESSTATSPAWWS